MARSGVLSISLVGCQEVIIVDKSLLDPSARDIES